MKILNYKGNEHNNYNVDEADEDLLRQECGGVEPTSKQPTEESNLRLSEFSNHISLTSKM